MRDTGLRGREGAILYKFVVSRVYTYSVGISPTLYRLLESLECSLS